MEQMQGNPFRVTRFMYGLARLIFRLTGWTIEGYPPHPPRFVLISAPHTSNWDGFLLITAGYLFRVRLSFYIKKEAFFFPFNYLVDYFGGIPIDRKRRRNMVAQAIEDYGKRENLILAIPPEGTRGKVDHWKTGFYYIALGAKVPLVLGYIDYKRKVCGLGPAFMPTGDIDKDFKVFREFYEKVTPRFPEHRGPVVPPPPRDGAAPSLEAPVAAGSASKAVGTDLGLARLNDRKAVASLAPQRFR